VGSPQFDLYVALNVTFRQKYGYLLKILALSNFCVNSLSEYVKVDKKVLEEMLKEVHEMQKIVNKQITPCPQEKKNVRRLEEQK